MINLNEEAVRLLEEKLVGQLVSVKLMWLGAPRQWMFITRIGYDRFGLYYELDDYEIYREPFTVLGVENRERRKRDFDSSLFYHIYDQASVIIRWKPFHHRELYPYQTTL